MHAYLLKSVFLKNPEDKDHKESGQLTSTKSKLYFLKKRIPFEIANVICICLRSRKQRKQEKNGLSRIERELEIKRFLKRQIKIKIAMKVLFSKVERFLIRNNRTFTITSDESDRSQNNRVTVEQRIETETNEMIWERFYELLNETGLPK